MNPLVSGDFEMVPLDGRFKSSCCTVQVSVSLQLAGSLQMCKQLGNVKDIHKNDRPYAVSLIREIIMNFLKSLSDFIG